jgi:hypothetical protein
MVHVLVGAPENVRDQAAVQQTACVARAKPGDLGYAPRPSRHEFDDDALFVGSG